MSYWHSSFHSLDSSLHFWNFPLKSCTPITAKMNKNNAVIIKILATFFTEYHMQRNTAWKKTKQRTKIKQARLRNVKHGRLQGNRMALGQLGSCDRYWRHCLYTILRREGITLNTNWLQTSKGSVKLVNWRCECFYGYSRSNSPLQKCEKTGEEYGCFPFVWKTKIFKLKIN